MRLYSIFILGGVLALGYCKAEDPEENGQVRRLNDGKLQRNFSSRRLGSVSHFNHGSRNSVRHQRPFLAAPPYAVQMEPLVQYSQRDPLYHQKLKNVTTTPESPSRTDHEAEPSNNIAEVSGHYQQGPEQRLYDTNPYPHHHHHYYSEPEPIIEIIIKESNESLPPPPPPPTLPPTPPTREPVHVFYIKYKKNPNPSKEGGDEVIYEAPVPAITPPSGDLVDDSHTTEEPYHKTTLPPPPPPPTTTLRTIIRPDSETYHGSGLRVTFGATEVHHGHGEQEEQSAPEPQIALPSSQPHFQSRDSTENPTPSHPVKRQQPFNPHFQYQQQSQSQPYVQQTQYSNRQNPNSQPQVDLTKNSYSQPDPTNAYINKNVGPVYQRSQQSQSSQVHLTHNAQSQQPNQQPQNPFHDQHYQPPNQSQRPRPHTQGQTFHQRPVPSNPPHIHQGAKFQDNQQRQKLPIPTPAQIQQYQQQKQLLHQQNLRQQALQQQAQNQNPHYHQTGAQVRPTIAQGSPTYQPFRPPPPSVHVPPLTTNQHYQRPQTQSQIPYNQQNKNLPQQNLPPQNNYQSFSQIGTGHVNTDYRNQNNQQQYNGAQLAPQYSGQNSQPVLGSQQQPSGVPHVQNPILQEPINNAEIVKAIPQLEEHLVQQTTKFANKNNNNVYYNQQNQHFDSSNARPSSLPLQSNDQHRPNSYLPQQRNRYQPVYSTTVPPEPSKQPVYSTPRSNYAVTSTTKTSTKLYHQPSTTERPRSDDSGEDQKEVDVTKKEENKKKSQANLAALPDEVPADLREQLLSSGILGNADIQVLDYDKVGDIPIESLPPEALENFYGAGSAPVPSVVKPGDPGLKPVQMKVVRYDPNTKEGQDVADTYVREDATRLDPVVLNDSRYNRYLPLKVSGTQFPLPDVPQLKGRIVNSVVVLAPVDYDFIKQPDEGEDRAGKAIQVQGVRFIAGESLKNLVKNPTQENYKKWLEQEKATPSERQSVVLLVTSDGGSVEAPNMEIFMYDISSENVSKLRGELSAAFVEVAESNSASQDLEGLSAPEEGDRPVPKDEGFKDRAEDLDMSPSEYHEEIFQPALLPPESAVLISSGYSKTSANSPMSL